MKFEEFFDRVYVINLPNRVDRRKRIEKELKRVGMPFSPGKVELFPAIKPESAAPFESIGYKGCFLSHLSILKQAKEQQLNNVLILEDDLNFLEDFEKYQEILVKQLLHLNWDMVYFGCKSPTPLHPEKAAFATLQPCPREVFETHMYAVNSRVFERLIHYLETLLQRPVGHPMGGPIPFDGALNVFQWKNPDVVRFVSVPALGYQGNSRSDIHTRWFDRVPLLNSAAYVARELGIVRMVKVLAKK